jgi:glycosyltransferase involved in cell wall biosynthesis
MKLISIVFSFRNEQENLEELINRTVNTLKDLSDWQYELIFVNDASTDNSEDILLKFQKIYPIKLINLSRRFGHGPAVMAGFENTKGDCIVYLDSDLQDPPELLVTLVNEYEKGFDVVHTKRIKRMGESRTKMLITSLAYFIINILSDIPLKQNVGEFKLISRRVLDQMLKLKEQETFLRGLSVWIGFKQTYIDYTRQPRFKGVTHFPLLGSSQPAKDFIRGITSFSLAPLYFACIAGILTIFLSFFLIIYFLYLKFNNLSTSGFASVYILICFFSGMILFTIGIASLYLARMWHEIKSRPRYIISEIKDYNK